MKVGVCGNHRYPELGTLLAQLVALASTRGIELFSEPRLADLWPVAPPDFRAVSLDVLLTFGGDGTLLRGARTLEGRGIPMSLRGRKDYTMPSWRLVWSPGRNFQSPAEGWI